MDDRAQLVAAVEAAIERLGTPDALGGHGLDLTGAWRAHAAGRPVAPELRRSARNAALVELATDEVLDRARRAVAQPLLVLKGPELAAGHPEPLRRPFWDLDVLVADGEAAQQDLLAAGFRPAGGEAAYEEHHHLAPLAVAGLPVPIEVHRGLGAQTWARVPPTVDLLARAVPSATGVDGVLALDPVDHAVFVANHAWRAAPLGRLGHLVDVQVLRIAARERHDDADRRLRETARAWRLGRVWSLTVAAIEGELLRTRRLDPRLWPFRSRLRHTNDHSLPTARQALVLAAAVRPLAARSGPLGRSLSGPGQPVDSPSSDGPPSPPGAGSPPG
jgi:hypothetical protein